jgi:hypothetical protein
LRWNDVVAWFPVIIEGLGLEMLGDDLLTARESVAATPAECPTYNLKRKFRIHIEIRLGILQHELETRGWERQHAWMRVRSNTSTSKWETFTCTLLPPVQ